MNLIVIKNGNERYGMLSTAGNIVKVDSQVIKDFKEKKKACRFSSVDFDENDNVVLSDTKGRRISVEVTVMQEAIQDIEEAEDLYTMLGPGPNDSYICGKGSNLYLFNGELTKLITKPMLNSLQRTGAHNYLNAINRAYKALVLKYLNSEESIEFYMDLLEYMFPQTKTHIAKSIMKA